MKKYLLVFIILLYTSLSYAQEGIFKHEIKLSYGIFNLPNGTRISDEDLWKGGFTGSYMYHVVRWFWIGANINWQFPSDMEYYHWREYYEDGSFKDFEISDRNTFLAIAPEFRFSYSNKKWVTLYSAFSVGYGIQKKIWFNNYYNSYWFWNITFFGGNWHFGKKQNFFFGGELGVGFKGTMVIHAGYRF